MNTIDCYVTAVTGEITAQYGKWWVPIEYDCEGGKGNTEVMCHTLANAEAVKVGWVFQQ